MKKIVSTHMWQLRKHEDQSAQEVPAKDLERQQALPLAFARNLVAFPTRIPQPRTPRPNDVP